MMAFFFSPWPPPHGGTGWHGVSHACKRMPCQSACRPVPRPSCAQWRSTDVRGACHGPLVEPGTSGGLVHTDGEKGASGRSLMASARRRCALIPNQPASLKGHALELLFWRSRVAAEQPICHQLGAARAAMSMAPSAMRACGQQSSVATVSIACARCCLASDHSTTLASTGAVVAGPTCYLPATQAAAVLS